MNDLNRVFLIGRLGRDAEKRTTQNGQELLNFSMATTKTWRGKEGDRREATEWHNITHWARQPGGLDKLMEYLIKGKLVHIEGEIRTRSWDDKEGQKHYRTEIHAMDVKLLGANAPGGQRQNDGYRQDQDQGRDRRGGGQSSRPEPTEVDLSDIPF